MCALPLTVWLPHAFHVAPRFRVISANCVSEVSLHILLPLYDSSESQVACISMRQCVRKKKEKEKEKEAWKQKPTIIILLSPGAISHAPYFSTSPPKASTLDCLCRQDLRQAYPSRMRRCPLRAMRGRGRRGQWFRSRSPMLADVVAVFYGVFLETTWILRADFVGVVISSHFFITVHMNLGDPCRW